MPKKNFTVMLHKKDQPLDLISYIKEKKVYFEDQFLAKSRLYCTENKTTLKRDMTTFKAKVDLCNSIIKEHEIFRKIT